MESPHPAVEQAILTVDELVVRDLFHLASVRSDRDGGRLMDGKGFHNTLRDHFQVHLVVKKITDVFNKHAKQFGTGTSRFITYQSFRMALADIAAYQFPHMPRTAAFTRLIQAARKQQPLAASSEPLLPSASGQRSTLDQRTEDAVAALLHRMLLLRWRSPLRQLGVHEAVDMTGVELRDLLGIGMGRGEAQRFLDSVAALDQAGALIAADLAEVRRREEEAHVSATEAAAASTSMQSLGDTQAHTHSSHSGGGGGGADWEECVRDDGYVYYYHHPTATSSWEEPPTGASVLTLAQKQRQLPPKAAALPRSPEQLQYASKHPRGLERQGWRDTWRDVVPSHSAAHEAKASSAQDSASVASDRSHSGHGRAGAPAFTPVQRRSARRAARDEYASAYASGAVHHSVQPDSVQAHIASRGDAELSATPVRTPGAPPRGTRMPISEHELDEAFMDLPSMTTETKRAVARSHVFASSRVRGYADPRPDITPSELARWRPGKEHGAAVNQLSTKDAAFAGELRPGHHREQPREGRSGKEIVTRTWNPPEKAPSDAVPSYAYRHAAARIQDSVFDRLTDTRGYTGTHRHRFDATGRGQGLKGRDAGDFDYGKLTQAVPVAGAPYLTEAPRGKFKAGNSGKK